MQMTPRQIAAWLAIEARIQRADSAMQLQINAIAASGDNKAIKELFERLRE